MYKQSNYHKCLPYSHQRIKDVLLKDYHIDLQPQYGYKSNRIVPYVNRYRMVNIDTKEILAERVTLNAIRILLTEEGYPLKETAKPCKGAIEFLEFVEAQKTKEMID